MQQGELADILGIHRSVLSRIEKGHRPIREDELLRIVRHFHVSTDDLLNNDPPCKHQPRHTVQTGKKNFSENIVPSAAKTKNSWTHYSIPFTAQFPPTTRNDKTNKQRPRSQSAARGRFSLTAATADMKKRSCELCTFLYARMTVSCCYYFSNAA